MAASSLLLTLGRAGSGRLLQALPNLISFGRLMAVPVVVWLILTGEFTAAFWLFVAAGISDALDGFIAKNFARPTVIGGYLDPLADKALLVSVYVALGHKGFMPVWLVILVVFRDVLIIGGAVVYQFLTQSLRMQPLFISKFNTAAQIAFAVAVLADLGLELRDGVVTPFLLHAVAATTILSGGAYVVVWSWKLARMEDDR